MKLLTRIWPYLDGYPICEDKRHCNDKTVQSHNDRKNHNFENPVDRESDEYGEYANGRKVNQIKAGKPAEELIQFDQIEVHPICIKKCELRGMFGESMLDLAGYLLYSKIHLAIL